MRSTILVVTTFALCLTLNPSALLADGSGVSSKPKSAVHAQSDQRVFVYYFHGTGRCPTCRKMEAYSRETIQNTFPDELVKGSLQWRVLNFDEPANKHFIKDFDLFASSLVLVQEVKGKPARYKNLDQIYPLAGRPDAFAKYVRDELRSFLKAS